MFRKLFGMPMDWVTASDRNTAIAIGGVVAVCVVIVGMGLRLLISTLG